MAKFSSSSFRRGISQRYDARVNQLDNSFFRVFLKKIQIPILSHRESFSLPFPIRDSSLRSRVSPHLHFSRSSIKRREQDVTALALRKPREKCTLVDYERVEWRYLPDPHDTVRNIYSSQTNEYLCWVNSVAGTDVPDDSAPRRDGKMCFAIPSFC